MLEFVGGIARCALGRHQRSQADVRNTGDQYVSACRFCRAPMRRLAKREWVVDRSLQLD